MDKQRLARFLMTCFFDCGKVLAGLNTLNQATQCLDPWNVAAAGVQNDLLASGLVVRVGTRHIDAEHDLDTGEVLVQAYDMPELAFTPKAMRLAEAMHAAAVAALAAGLTNV